MQRQITLAWPVVCALAIAGCSGTPETVLSPSAATPEISFANPDGSTIKVGAPTGLSPNGEVVSTRRPQLSFRAPTGRFVQAPFEYEIEAQQTSGTALIAIGTATTYTHDSDLPLGDTIRWRVRVRMSGEVGPWSEWAEFSTPAPATAASRGLPFSIPASCGAFGPGDRVACAIEVAGLSPYWPACQAGSGTNCHRFTRHVAAALAAADPRWGLITKNPGEQQCTWNGCGPGAGDGFGEDIVAYLHGPSNFDWQGFDLVQGAGAPGARVHWNSVPSRRPGNNWAEVPPFPE
jgi:hypothetical protein